MNFYYRSECCGRNYTNIRKFIGVDTKMKITIEPELGETNNITVLEGVYQFSLCGLLKKEGILKDIFRVNVIDDPNELIGLLRMTELDIVDFKVNKKKSQIEKCNEKSDSTHQKNISQ